MRLSTRFSRTAALAFCVAVAGCSNGRLGGASTTQSKRLDVLTSFTLALSRRDFVVAAACLSPQDKRALADGESGILPEYRSRMVAMRLTTLMNNPLIEVSHGKIDGIREILPIIAQGEKWNFDSAEVPMETGFAKGLAHEDSLRRQAEVLRRTSASFFRAVRQRDWQGAMAYLDPQERQGFVKPDGSLREGTRRRLAKADTSSWDALTLKEGKLTGVVLIIPSR